MSDTLAFLGCDVETTGLHSRAKILEIGLIAYDQQLQEIETYRSIILPPNLNDLMRHTPETVRFMHHRSGLWSELKHAEMKLQIGQLPPDHYSLPKVEARAMMWVESFLMEHKPYMLGSSIHFDRTMLRREMPNLADLFHHQSVDATSFYLVAKAKGASFPDAGDTQHRVIADIRQSRELITASLAKMSSL